MTRLRYISIRTVQTLLLLWLVLSLLFVFFRLMPGDYASMMLYQGASPESVEAMRARWGLDQPLYMQYFSYITNFIVGDFGDSLVYRIPVWELVKDRMFNSFVLVAPGITAAYLLGSVYGTILGNNRGKNIEKFGIAPIVLAGAFPSFFVAIVLIVVFAVALGWFPSGGIGDVTQTDQSFVQIYLSTDFAYYYLLPFSAVVIRYLYLPTLIMRTSVVEVKEQDFFYYQRMTGIPKIRRLRHLMKNASLPVITLYPVSMTRAIGGLVLIEIVFSWPGIGFTLVEAVFARDFPVIQFVFFLVAAFVIISNFIVDIVYGYIDPRVTVGGE